MLAIVDYGAGNLTSVARALKKLNIPCQISADPDVIAASAGVVFPGVGNAGQAMASLRRSGMDRALARTVERTQPLLGICVGCQILLEHSEEENTTGLGLAPGKCLRFEDGLLEENGKPINIPHMGWNSLIREKDSPLLAGVPEDAEFYFVHSYYAAPPEEMVIASSRYGREFCSIYGRDNLFAVQFHPEKSGEAGLKILSNFYSLALKCSPNAS